MGIDILEVATAAINGWKYLTLECAHCGRTERFRGAVRNDAVDKAIRAGWHGRGDKELCKKCP